MLEYLKVLLTFPVVGGALVFVFFLVYRNEIRTIIKNIGKVKFPGVEFSMSQQQKIEEQPTPAGPITAPSPPTFEGMHLSGTDLQELRAYFEAERAAARIWEYRYLNYYLAPSTQIVLDWLIGLKQPTTISAFEAVWMHSIQQAEERHAVLHALQLHVLIITSGQTISLTDKGREYAQWPERRTIGS